MKEENLRTASLLGKGSVRRLEGAKVAVFGIGGVGSYAVEALVRAGVGALCLYDSDVVAKSNINRQLIAMQSTVGVYKTEAAKKRCLDINPDCEITEKREFITPQSVIPFEDFDFVIDAVDNITAKLFLICSAQNAGTPIISVMGTGNKLDPTRIRIGDIYATSVCPLARVMRYELKKRGINRQEVVWSDEAPIKPDDCGEYRDTGRIPPGSMSFVPGAAGLAAAAAAIKKIIGSELSH